MPSNLCDSTRDQLTLRVVEDTQLPAECFPCSSVTHLCVVHGPFLDIIHL